MKSQRFISSFGPGPTLSLGRRPSLLQASRAAARRRSSPEICSGQFDVENPIVLISSGLLVQSDEGVSDLVVDRIGVSTAVYREEPDYCNHGWSQAQVPERDRVVVSTINGKTVEISEELFAETFKLPVEGLIDMNDVLKDLVFDARIVFSYDGEQIETSDKKRKMKIEFRLLNDILAKSVTMKAGSFDAVTLEIFLMMAAINRGIPINWSKVLFNIFKDMVTTGSRQAKGFAIQICFLLKNVPHLELGDSKEFPSSRILTEKTIHRYIAVNDKVGVEEVADVPREAVPLQVIEPTPAAPAEQPPVPKQKLKKRRLQLQKDSDDEIVRKRRKTTADLAAEAPAVEGVEEQREVTSAALVVEETFVGGLTEKESEPTMENEPVVESTAEEIEKDEGEQDVDGTNVGGTTVGGSDVGAQETPRYGETDQWFNLSYEEFYTREADTPIETASDIDEEPETAACEIVAEEQPVPSADETVSRSDAPADYPVIEALEEVEMAADEQSTGDKTSADEAMSLEEILLTIPVAFPLTSAVGK
ncbi:patatin-like protein 2 [Dorcoceras hygrometricum]|uniref:Patatin-like protein 2 n=1 Tax=Dorcoceras hygrometricum TaxID=472368 RepID=A0A2Z7DBF0_9LAMI|nr:patatin-like protein 2 [Dorcoceras hygrometricum]